MKKWVGLLLIVSWAPVTRVPVLNAQEPPKPIKALLVLGGCCHDYAQQKDFLTRGHLSAGCSRVDRRLRSRHDRPAQEPRLRQSRLGQGL